ncbi:hypothetical protein D1872_274630 [compost metagenome]
MDSLLSQRTGELVRTGIQLPVGEAVVAEYDGYLLRGLHDLLLEYTMNGVLSRKVCLSIIKYC